MSISGLCSLPCFNGKSRGLGFCTSAATGSIVHHFFKDPNNMGYFEGLQDSLLHPNHTKKRWYPSRAGGPTSFLETGPKPRPLVKKKDIIHYRNSWAPTILGQGIRMQDARMDKMAKCIRKHCAQHQKSKPLRDALGNQLEECVMQHCGKEKIINTKGPK